MITKPFVISAFLLLWIIPGRNELTHCVMNWSPSASWFENCVSMNWIALFFNAEGNSCAAGANHGTSQFMPIRAIHYGHAFTTTEKPSLSRVPISVNSITQYWIKALMITKPFVISAFLLWIIHGSNELTPCVMNWSPSASWFENCVSMNWIAPFLMPQAIHAPQVQFMASANSCP